MLREDGRNYLAGLERLLSSRKTKPEGSTPEEDELGDLADGIMEYIINMLSVERGIQREMVFVTPNISLRIREGYPGSHTFNVSGTEVTVPKGH